MVVRVGRVGAQQAHAQFAVPADPMAAGPRHRLVIAEPVADLEHLRHHQGHWLHVGQRAERNIAIHCNMAQTKDPGGPAEQAQQAWNDCIAEPENGFAPEHGQVQKVTDDAAEMWGLRQVLDGDCGVERVPFGCAKAGSRPTLCRGGELVVHPLPTGAVPHEGRFDARDFAKRLSGWPGREPRLVRRLAADLQEHQPCQQQTADAEQTTTKQHRPAMRQQYVQAHRSGCWRNVVHFVLHGVTDNRR